MDTDIEVLFDDRHIVMAGVQNKWVRRRNIALGDLIDEPWVLPPPDSVVGLSITEAFRDWRYRPKCTSGAEPPRRPNTWFAEYVAMCITITRARLASHFLFSF